MTYYYPPQKTNELWTDDGTKKFYIAIDEKGNLVTKEANNPENSYKHITEQDVQGGNLLDIDLGL